MRITKDVATMKNHKIKIDDDDINLNKRHSSEVKLAFIFPICSKSFKRHQDQKKHITVMHPEPNIIKRSFTCKIYFGLSSQNTRPCCSLTSDLLQEGAVTQISIFTKIFKSFQNMIQNDLRAIKVLNQCCQIIIQAK